MSNASSDHTLISAEKPGRGSEHLSPVLSSQAHTTVIAMVGTSLTAGWSPDAPKNDTGSTEKKQIVIPVPAQLETLLDKDKHPVKIINEGVPGNTAAQELARIKHVLARDHPDVVAVEAGTNEELRGISPEVLRRNLEKIRDTINPPDAAPGSKKIPLVLMGNDKLKSWDHKIQAYFDSHPKNHCISYPAQEYHQVYQDVAHYKDGSGEKDVTTSTENKAPVVFYENYLKTIKDNPRYFQRYDKVHPNTAGNARIAADLEPLFIQAKDMADAEVLPVPVKIPHKAPSR